MKNNKKGFTLVEIMIVVVIIGLLAAMAIPAFTKVRRTSQNKAIVNNIRQIQSAADQYFLEEGVTTVPLEELMGTNSYIKGDGTDFASANLSLRVATENYPTDYTQGVDAVITDAAAGVGAATDDPKHKPDTAGVSTTFTFSI